MPETVTLVELGWPAWTTAVVVVAALVALLREVGSPAQVMLGAVVVLMLTGVVTPEAALSGFSNPAMLTVGALFVVAAAVRKTGALGFLEQVMKPRAESVPASVARVMLPASLLSGFLNNTPIVAFLTPMVQQWCRRSGTPASKLLMPLSFATILGGIATLIGTSTNLVVSNLLEQHGQRPFSMFELAWVGVPAALVGCLYFVTLGHRLLPDGSGAVDGARRGRRAYQFDLLVPPDSSLVGRTVEDAGLRHLEDAFLAHLLRRGQLIGPLAPGQVLEPGDLLTFIGDPVRLQAMLDGGQLERTIRPPDDNGELPELPFYEAVVSADSTLVGKSLKQSGFRERFQGVVLGIHRRGRQLRGPIGLTAIEPGDLLLIEAGPNFEDMWAQSGEFYLVAPLERELRTEPRKAGWVLAILLALMTSVTLGWLPMVSAAFAAAILVVLCGSLSPTEARRSVQMSVLVVIASAFGLGQAIQESGLAAWLGGNLVQLGAGMGVVGALFVIYLATNLLTEILTNSVAAVLLFPVGMAVAAGTGLDVRAVAVTIAVAASASFATPIGYQTNLMVMAPGGYRFRDYPRVGLPLNLLILVLTLWIVPAVWLR